MCQSGSSETDRQTAHTIPVCQQWLSVNGGTGAPENGAPGGVGGGAITQREMARQEPDNGNLPGWGKKKAKHKVIWGRYHRPNTAGARALQTV